MSLIYPAASVFGGNVLLPTHAALLDRLHAETMECIAQGRDFGEGWAGLEFAKLLEEHATGGSNEDLLTNGNRRRGRSPS